MCTYQEQTQSVYTEYRCSVLHVIVFVPSFWKAVFHWNTFLTTNPQIVIWPIRWSGQGWRHVTRDTWHVCSCDVWGAPWSPAENAGVVMDGRGCQSKLRIGTLLLHWSHTQADIMGGNKISMTIWTSPAHFCRLGKEKSFVNCQLVSFNEVIIYVVQNWWHWGWYSTLSSVASTQTDWCNKCFEVRILQVGCVFAAVQCLKHFVVSFMKTLERWLLSLITGRVFCLSQIHHTAHPPGPSLAPDQNIFKYSQPRQAAGACVCLL